MKILISSLKFGVGHVAHLRAYMQLVKSSGYEAAAFASITQKIELQRNTVNLFIEDTEGFIQNLAQDGIKKIAEEYLKIEQAKRMESDDIDFGNLDVRIQADEERYYCIKPNWNEEIFMSKPDVLDMVRIEFDLEYGKILCGTMPSG